MRASVRNSGALSQTLGAPPRYRCGLQFLEVADADRLFLLGLVYKHLSSARGSYSAQSERNPNAA